MNTTPPYTCWIFCNVIDNFGDIGVSWRLARVFNMNSAGKCIYGQTTSRLFRHSALTWLQSQYPSRHRHSRLASRPCRRYRYSPYPRHRHRNLRLRNCPTTFKPSSADTDHFGSTGNTSVRKTATKRLHLMPLTPTGGIQKYFWFMGFSEKSGGLLRERDYAEFCPL